MSIKVGEDHIDPDDIKKYVHSLCHAPKNEVEEINTTIRKHLFLITHYQFTAHDILDLIILSNPYNEKPYLLIDISSTISELAEYHFTGAQMIVMARISSKQAEIKPFKISNILDFLAKNKNTLLFSLSAPSTQQIYDRIVNLLKENPLYLKPDFLAYLTEETIPTFSRTELEERQRPHEQDGLQDNSFDFLLNTENDDVHPNELTAYIAKFGSPIEQTLNENDVNYFCAEDTPSPFSVFENIDILTDPLDSLWEQLTDNESLTPAEVQAFCLQQGMINFQAIEADGNCFFRAILVGLNLPQSLHTNLRQKAIDYLNKNINELGDFATVYEIKHMLVDFETYIKEMQGGAWAEGLIIDAVAKLLNISIILTDLEKKSDEIKTNQLAYQIAGSEGEQTGIHLIRVNQNHYHFGNSTLSHQAMAQCAALFQAPLETIDMVEQRSIQIKEPAATLINRIPSKNHVNHLQQGAGSFFSHPELQPASKKITVKKTALAPSAIAENVKLWREFINKLPKNNPCYNVKKCPAAEKKFCEVDTSTFNTKLAEVVKCRGLIEDYGVFLSIILGIANTKNGSEKLMDIRTTIELLKQVAKSISPKDVKVYVHHFSNYRDHIMEKNSSIKNSLFLISQYQFTAYDILNTALYPNALTYITCTIDKLADYRFTKMQIIRMAQMSSNGTANSFNISNILAFLVKNKNRLLKPPIALSSQLIYDKIDGISRKFNAGWSRNFLTFLTETHMTNDSPAKLNHPQTNQNLSQEIQVATSITESAQTSNVEPPFKKRKLLENDANNRYALFHDSTNGISITSQPNDEELQNLWQFE